VLTLVGPHRDDFIVLMFNGGKTAHNVKFYGSRGQTAISNFAAKNVAAVVLSKNY